MQNISIKYKLAENSIRTGGTLHINAFRAVTNSCIALSHLTLVMQVNQSPQAYLTWAESLQTVCFCFKVKVITNKD
jgi:hypothetical protein